MAWLLYFIFTDSTRLCYPATHNRQSFCLIIYCPTKSTEYTILFTLGQIAHIGLV